MPQHPSLTPRPSTQHAAWEKALNGGDSALLAHLAATGDPSVALLVLETYINGLYRGSLHPLSRPKTEIESKVARALPFVDEIRTRLGWRIRDFDLGLLRKRAKEPSETHRAIAELAHAQEAPDCGPGLFPGRDAIITYNIDALMCEALTEQKVPHAARAMKGDGLRGALTHWPWKARGIKPCIICTDTRQGACS